jgi:hypothetical protein
MKKLFTVAILAVVSLSALAQTTTTYYKFEDTAWNIAGRFGISYNFVTSVPDNMSHNGLGLDLCLFEGQYRLSEKSMVSLGVLNLEIDFRYLQKGYIFTQGKLQEGCLVTDGPWDAIVRAPEDSRAKAHLTDVVFSFPFGFTQKLSNRWEASVYVAPGLGLVRCHNNHISEDVHYHTSYYPIHNRTGFRLDLKAVIWHEDMGLMLRYQPIGYTHQESDKKNQTISLGLTFRY